jgi:hypothetical protein
VLDDELPKVTAAMLRRPETMCGLRLSHEHANHRSNRLGTGRFRLANQIVEHARLAQVELGPPQAAAFAPLELEPEEQRVYEHATATYLQLFGGRRARTVDLDAWETAVPEVGVRLVGGGGLPLEGEDGDRELRFVSLGHNDADPADPLVSVDARFALLRHSAWVESAPVRLVHVDLLFSEVVEHVVDADMCMNALRSWLEERVQMVRDRVQEARPRVGLECGRCRYVVRCPAHG